MGYEQREGAGVLFKNNRKNKDTHPDYTGNALINGKEMDIAAWVKEGRNGKFMSLSIKPKDEQRSGGSRPSRPMPDEDDGIPF